MAKLMTRRRRLQRDQAGQAQRWTTSSSSPRTPGATGGASSGGSTMFAELNCKISVEDLIRSVIIQSGNDAAIALAEGIAGSETTFARIDEPAGQGDRPHRLELRQLRPACRIPISTSTARDLAILARYLIMTYPRILPDLLRARVHLEQDQAGQPQFAGRDGHRRRWPQDRPHRGGRLRHCGLDQCRRAPADRRAPRARLDERARRGSAQAHHLGHCAASSCIPVFAEGQTVGYANVYGGAMPSVALVGKGTIDLFIPKGAENCPQAAIVYQGPLRPPVEAGRPGRQARGHVRRHGGAGHPALRRRDGRARATSSASRRTR